MTAYDPNPSVFINSTLIDPAIVIDDISVTMGRPNILEQPSPGYARVTLWTTADNAIDVSLSQELQIKVESSLYDEPTRTNLIPNPSFETNLTLWTAVGSGIFRITTDSFVGVACCEVQKIATANRGIITTTTAGSRIPVTPGIPYTFSVYVKVATGQPSASLRIRTQEYQASGTRNADQVSATTVVTDTQGWVRLSFTDTPTGGANPTETMAFQIEETTTNARNFLIDGALLEQSSTLGDYFDGSTTIPLGAAWTGTPNASTSTLTGELVSIFNGIISDINIELANYGDIGNITTYTLTAVGPLASLNQKLAGAANYPKEFEGNRILKILTEAFLTEWDDVSATLNWTDMPDGVTWDSYDGVNNTLVTNLTTDIDTPGVYELMAYTDGDANALILAQEAAQSGRGVLSEHGDGSLHYDDYSTRAGFTALTLTKDDILASGLKTAAQWSEIVNDVTVTYRAGEANARDEQSIILYGQLSGTRATTLHNLVDAETQADQFAEARAYPRVYPEQFIIPLHSPTVTDTTRDALAIVYCGLPITTSDLPAVFGTTFEGYVEGWSWAIRQKQAILTLIASAQSETYPSIVWYQIPSGTTWTAYPNLVKWEDL